jgi:hypothetical protein
LPDWSALHHKVGETIDAGFCVRSLIHLQIMAMTSKPVHAALPLAPLCRLAITSRHGRFQRPVILSRKDILPARSAPFLVQERSC